jgi:Fe-S cluster assembly protein SufD
MKVKKFSPVVKQALDHYHHELDQLIESSDTASLNDMRNQAMSTLSQQGFPTQRDEDWQYTRLTSFVGNHYKAHISEFISAAQVNQFLPDFAVTKIVFVDGWFSELHSDDLTSLPKNVTLETFQDLAENGAIKALYEDQDNVNKEAFGLLNSALAVEGFYLKLEANAHLELPLFVLHIQTNDQQSIQVRNRIELAHNSELTLVERYVSLHDDNNSFTNVVTRIDVAKHARLNQIVLQQQNLKSYYFNNQFIYQAEESVVNSFFGSSGAQISRHQNHLTMQGSNIESQQNSACLAKQNQVVDSRTYTEHNGLTGVSRQLHKYVLTGKSTGVFNGMIRVDELAQQTDGQMDNKNLLLSDDAKMNTKPQLEIYADDVKCSHGSATGQIDLNQIFYLQARGIKRADAVAMITHAFLLEPLESIQKSEIKNWVSHEMTNALENI